MLVNFGQGKTRRRYVAVLYSILVSVASLCVATPGAVAGPELHSPEDRSPIELDMLGRPRCLSNAQCSVVVSGSQDPRCLTAICDPVTRQCATRVNATLSLGEEVTTCAKSKRVCGSDGVPINSGAVTPLNNGKACVPTEGGVPVCKKATCSQGQCVLQNLADNTACVDPDPESAFNKALTVCQKSVCSKGTCSKAIADAAKVGVQCGSPVTQDCLLTSLKCSTTGTCSQVLSPVAGAQCATNAGKVVLASATELPAWYTNLLKGAAQPPAVTCTSECKLQGCGDRVVNGSEQCDGGLPSSFVPARGKTVRDYECTTLCTIRQKKPCEGVVKTPASCPVEEGEQTTSICVQNPNGTIKATWNAPPQIFFLGSAYKGWDKQALVEQALRGNIGQNCWACGCWRVNGCFTPETKILMSDGSYRAVRDISAGEYVLNPVTHGPAKVSRIVQGPEKIDLVELRYGDSVLVVSSKHPMVTARGVVQAAKLSKRDFLIDRDGAKQALTSVKRVPAQEGQQVINLVLDESLPSNQKFIVAEGVQTGDLSVQLSQTKKRK